MKGNANLLRYNLMFGWNAKRFTLSNYIPACRQANWIGSYLNKIFKARYLRLLFPLATIMWSKILIQSFGERFLRLVIFIYSDFWYSWRFKILSKILFRYKLLKFKTNKANLNYSNLFSINSLFSFLPYTKLKLVKLQAQSKKKSKSKLFFTIPKLLKISLNNLFFKRRIILKTFLRLKNKFNFQYRTKNFTLFLIVLKYFYNYFNLLDLGNIKIKKKLFSFTNYFNPKFRIFKINKISNSKKNFKSTNKFLKKKNNRINKYNKYKKYKKFIKTKFNRYKLKWIYFSKFRVYQKHKISVKVNYLQKFYVSVLRIIYDKLTYFSNIYFFSFINFKNFNFNFNMLFNVNVNTIKEEYNKLFFYDSVNFSLNLKNICLYLLFYNNFELNIKNFILFLNLNNLYYSFKKAFSINNLNFYLMSFLNSRKFNNVNIMSKTNLFYIID